MDVPKHWTIDLAQGMRIATYLIAAGSGEGAECAVYYFGPGQGGGVDANLQRWMGEFQPLQKHDVRKLKPGGIETTRIQASGTYVAHSMRSPGATPAEKPDWALLGAILDGPNGEVFFKLTGPARPWMPPPRISTTCWLDQEKVAGAAGGTRAIQAVAAPRSVR
jgi:hypothetical protein